jgi:hypothetical protein
MAQGTSFTKEEFAGLDFHSVRLEERFVTPVPALNILPKCCVSPPDPIVSKIRKKLLTKKEKGCIILPELLCSLGM